ERKRISQAVNQADGVESVTSDIDTLFELGREGEDVTAEIEREMKRFTEQVQALEDAMLLSGENDHRAAILNVHPGAGGTESQDWAQMLLRMYLRWAERKGFKITITDQQEGEGAGIKNATVEIDGE